VNDVERGHGIAAWRSGRWLLIGQWLAALGFTYAAGRLAVDVAKWVILLYLAPAGEAKLILVGYLLGAFFPVVLLALIAGWAWFHLFRSADRAEVGLVLLVELASLAVVDFRPVQEAVANYLQ
jgi:uncharacterized membrane protein